jgi:putative transposase
MPRNPRIVLTDVVHHVVARGVNRQRIFSHGFDKRKYLRRFAELAAEEQVLVHGYCLMDNHVHWLLTPATPDGLARLFRRAHTWWAMLFNRKQHRCGHLFQNRFHSSPLGENHYWTALRYVEVNPRRAGLVKQLEDWEFSSAKTHVTNEKDPLIDLAPVDSRRTFTSEQWREFLQHPDAGFEQDLRRSQAASRPCGTAEWIHQLEQEHGRKLAWSPPGRPATSKLAVSAA